MAQSHCLLRRVGICRILPNLRNLFISRPPRIERNSSYRYLLKFNTNPYWSPKCYIWALSWGSFLEFDVVTTCIIYRPRMHLGWVLRGIIGTIPSWTSHDDSNLTDFFSLRLISFYLSVGEACYEIQCYCGLWLFISSFYNLVEPTILGLVSVGPFLFLGLVHNVMTLNLH